jgi:hypothetical protein
MSDGLSVLGRCAAGSALVRGGRRPIERADHLDHQPIVGDVGVRAPIVLYVRWRPVDGDRAGGHPPRLLKVNCTAVRGALTNPAKRRWPRDWSRRCARSSRSWKVRVAASGPSSRRHWGRDVLGEDGVRRGLGQCVRPFAGLIGISTGIAVCPWSSRPPEPRCRCRRSRPPRSQGARPQSAADPARPLLQLRVYWSRRRSARSRRPGLDRVSASCNAGIVAMRRAWCHGPNDPDLSRRSVGTGVVRATSVQRELDREAASTIDLGMPDGGAYLRVILRRRDVVTRLGQQTGRHRGPVAPDH